VSIVPCITLVYLVNLRRAILKLFLLLSHLVGYTSSLINKCCDDARPNYTSGISASFFMICATTALVIALINIASFNRDVTITYSYITSL
jgi:hypothetical protein